MLRHPSTLGQLLKVAVNGVPTAIVTRGHAISATNNLINLSVDDKNGIATLTLNRPPVNSLNHALLKDIASALDDVEKNRSKGLILTSVSVLYMLNDANQSFVIRTYATGIHVDSMELN